MKLKNAIIFSVMLIIIGCGDKKEEAMKASENLISLTATQANRLAALPMACIQVEYPNKLGQTLESDANLLAPKSLHPAFYGCFDWHSSVLGHWSLVSLLKQFPDLANREPILAMLETNISKENIEKEVAYFDSKSNRSFERTYGWAWLLKLQMELTTWEDRSAQQMARNLQPLSDHLVNSYLNFLPKLQYPIRTGDHPNTAFGLSFAHDYAVFSKNDSLKSLIEKRAIDFFANDKGCPINWEPSGYDFFSPCLEEIGLMQRVLPAPDFEKWLKQFMPEILNDNFQLAPGVVGDRSDGTLVHLDGLNFSRAWNLYALAKSFPNKTHLRKLADEHVRYSLDQISDENYEGTHWLGTFALRALQAAE